jgi:hypothetical protein
MNEKLILEKLMQNQNVAGYQSPSGRITYNKVVNNKSFAAFTDIIESIVPLDIVNNPDKNKKLPSIAKAFKRNDMLPYYFYVNSTMDEYMDYETEEDQENMDDLLEHLDNKELKTSLMGICIQKNEHMQSAHACAFIVWKSSSKRYKFAFYDPLDHKKGKKSFDYAERAFVSGRFTQKIEFINLNKYCFHKTPEEFHCSQYIINAEYCYIYSLFFLHKWIEYGKKLHRSNFRKTIKATYIVSPEKLTRANDNESLKYRLLMMAFICSSLLNFLGGLKKKDKTYIKYTDNNIKRIEEYVNNFKDVYGFSLIK